MPLILEGTTLGDKHKNFNILVADAVADANFQLTRIKTDDNDADYLHRIDTACKKRNVYYIYEILKGDDMLYISRVIKKCPWLINDQEYEDIIEPEYLYKNLFPHMLVKAINKLLLRIRVTLKDESRVEAFYNYFARHETDDHVCEKWLLNCSLPFIENVIQERRTISLYIFKRLCKRSVIFLKYYTKVEPHSKWGALLAVSFLLKSDTEEFLNVLDTVDLRYFPKLGQKHTEVIMKKFPHRIWNRFDRYKDNVDLSTVAKYMDKKKIKDFVVSQYKKPTLQDFFSLYENAKHFINAMPIEERYPFVKSMYIDKNISSHSHANTPSYGNGNGNGHRHGNGHGHDNLWVQEPRPMPSCTINTCIWYQYAPFNEAFTEIKRLVHAESSPVDRCALLSLLLTSAKGNPENIKYLLQYFYDRHRNEPFKFKIQFIINVIHEFHTHDFDIDTWNILDKLFHTAEVYFESDTNVQACLKCIVVYKVLHDEPVPEIVEKKMNFNTFKRIQHKLNAKQQSDLFSYLLSSISTQILSTVIINESSFDKCIVLLIHVLNLLKDWKKDLREYPFILDKIRELITLQNEYGWKTNLGPLYGVNKSWRRLMFEESLMLYPSEGVCINALKHDPQLFVRYSDKVAAMRTDDKISLFRFLAKLRIYWPNTFAQEWINAYLNNINNNTGQNAAVKGLLMLLPRDGVRDIAKKYAPTEAKVDWGEIDQNVFRLRKYIAHNLHIARPLPSMELVLGYAKGDYLQYTVPALNSFVFNISKIRSRDHMSALLKAPVSLQKFGLMLAFNKLGYAELKPIFADIWKNTKNSSIRTHLFSHTYKLLCKLKEPSLIKELWELLSVFIDNLGTEENIIIYAILGKPKDVHVSVKGQFLMKSFIFLSLHPHIANCDILRNGLISYAPDIVDLLDPGFIENVVLEYALKQVKSTIFQYGETISSYVLHGKTEDEQCKRFEKVLRPILEYATMEWNTVIGSYFVARDNIDMLIRSLTWGIRKYLPMKKIIIPVKLFLELDKFFTRRLSVVDSYERRICWQITTEYVVLLAEHRNMFSNPDLDKLSQSDYSYSHLPEEAERAWEKAHVQISRKFGPIITKLLQRDTKDYFPTICLLFSSALNKAFCNLSFPQLIMKMETLKYMIMNIDFVPSYIAVIETMPVVRYGMDDELRKFKQIDQILSSHSSLEVKMHYQKAFGHMVNL